MSSKPIQFLVISKSMHKFYLFSFLSHVKAFPLYFMVNILSFFLKKSLSNLLVSSVSSSNNK